MNRNPFQSTLSPSSPRPKGNVIRVLSRLHAFGDDPASGAGVKALQRMADSLLHGSRPGDWNQAMMELGATVCSPKAPQCASCPVVRAQRGRSWETGGLPACAGASALAWASALEGIACEGSMR